MESNKKNMMMMMIRTTACHKELIECVDEHETKRNINCKERSKAERSKAEFS